MSDWVTVMDVFIVNNYVCVHNAICIFGALCFDELLLFVVIVLEWTSDCSFFHFGSIKINHYFGNLLDVRSKDVFQSCIQQNRFISGKLCFIKLKEKKLKTFLELCVKMSGMIFFLKIWLKRTCRGENHYLERLPMFEHGQLYLR